MNEQARKFCKCGALNFKPANSSTKVSGHFSQNLFGKSSAERKRADEVLLKRSGEVWEEDVYTQSDWRLQSLSTANRIAGILVGSHSIFC